MYAMSGRVSAGDRHNQQPLFLDASTDVTEAFEPIR
jgi:hypothetical protein